MNAEEFLKIANGLKAVYTYQNFLADDSALEIWFNLLSDLPYKAVSLAVKEYMSTETRIPTIADIRERVSKYIDGQSEQLNEMQAWGLVSLALRDSTYHAKERFDNLPPVVQRAVGSPDNLRAWAMDEHYNENVAQSHFIACYRTACEREKKLMAIPTDVRNLLTSTTQKMIGERYD